MHRRTLTLYISAVAVIIAILVAERLPVPYVILGPGPTLNTLGKDQSGKPLITITGHRVYPTTRPPQHGLDHLSRAAPGTSSTCSPRCGPG